MITCFSPLASAVERPMFHFCEDSTRAYFFCRFWWKYFFELAISTRTFRALYAEGADRWSDRRLKKVCPQCDTTVHARRAVCVHACGS